MEEDGETWSEEDRRGERRSEKDERGEVERGGVRGS